MTDEHTPGPWVIYGGVQHKGEFLIHNGATDIAVTYWALGDCNANARLIAAAPDLLAALQTLLESDLVAWFPPWSPEGNPEKGEPPWSEELNQRAAPILAARAAIAKATGG